MQMFFIVTRAPDCGDDLCGLLLEVAVQRGLVGNFGKHDTLGISSSLRDEVVAVLVLLEATKGHLGARNILFGVLEVCEL